MIKFPDIIELKGLDSNFAYIKNKVIGVLTWRWKLIIIEYYRSYIFKSYCVYTSIYIIIGENEKKKKKKKTQIIISN